MEILVITIIALLSAYAGLLMGSVLSFFIAKGGFIRPKGLWNLVPFRVGGWESKTYNDKRIYRLRWIFSKIDFNNYYIKK